MKEADKEHYLKRGTLAVLGVMKDLLQAQTPLLVNFTWAVYQPYAGGG